MLRWFQDLPEDNEIWRVEARDEPDMWMLTIHMTWGLLTLEVLRDSVGDLEASGDLRWWPRSGGMRYLGFTSVTDTLEAIRRLTGQSVLH